MPQKLATQVTTLQAAHYKNKITAMILAKSGQLMSAYNKFDSVTGCRMADRNRELADSINLLPDDPLLLEIANPLVDANRHDEKVVCAEYVHSVEGVPMGWLDSERRGQMGFATA